MDSLPQSELLLYQTEDGRTRVDVRVENETVWLSLNDMAQLFDRDKSVISRHIRNVFAEGELERGAVVANFATTASDGKTYQVEHFNLDVIISVGYRVKSLRGTQFRIWATQRLRDYIIKGFALDDERLKRAGKTVYFDELLERIRDIRSSEKMFWQKVLDIYATSVDYDPDIDMSHRFFAAIQNKMHWAAHGHTAAELIYERADASKPNMGLTHWPGAQPRKSDIKVAKNYLAPDELETLNRLVSFYLEFAELQAHDRRPMYMKDWIKKLDDFLRLSERDILSHAGSISHSAALEKAENQFETFRRMEAAQPSRAEKDFEKAINEINALQKKLPKTARQPKP